MSGVGIKNGTISTAFAGYSPFSLYYSASNRTKAEAGTLLEELLKEAVVYFHKV